MINNNIVFFLFSGKHPNLEYETNYVMWVFTLVFISRIQEDLISKKKLLNYIIFLDAYGFFFSRAKHIYKKLSTFSNKTHIKNKMIITINQWMNLKWEHNKYISKQFLRAPECIQKMLKKRQIKFAHISNNTNKKGSSKLGATKVGKG